MSQIEFNDEKRASLLYAKFHSSSDVPTMVRWLISLGIAKTPEQANKVLIGVAVAAVLVTIIVVYRMSSTGDQKPIPAVIQNTLYDSN